MSAAWSLSPLALALAALAAAHELGVRRLAAAGGDGRERPQAARQAWLVRLGVLAALGALLTPLAGLARRELFAAALVDFALGFVAAPLLVLGAPWRPLAAAWRRPPAASTMARRSVALCGGEAAGRRSPVPGQPATGVLAVLSAFWLWHLPSVLDATASSAALRQLEYASFLVGGLLFWSEIVASHPVTPRLGQLQRTALLVAAFAGYSALAALIVLEPHSWYPAFASLPDQLLPASLSQEFAGGVMWALPSIPLGVATFWCFAGWLEHEGDDERRLAELYAQLRASQAPAGATVGRAEEDRG